MRFQTERPKSWQVCLRCGNEATELDPHPRCPSCGGLREVRHRPPKLTRAELIEHVWDFAFDGDARIVDVYVRYLRRKIDEPFGRRDIETLRGAGYRIGSS